MCALGIFSGAAAAMSAASVATGAAILKAAGHAAYNVSHVTKAAALGGFVGAIPLFIVSSCARCLFVGKEDTIGRFALAAADAAVSGLLGYLMLYASDEDQQMSAEQFAAATAV